LLTAANTSTAHRHSSITRSTPARRSRSTGIATCAAGFFAPAAAAEDAGWAAEDVDWFIPHQANVRIIESVAKGLNLSMDKMFVNLDRYGNTSAASVGIALAEAVDFGRIKVGDKIVLVAFGAGLTSGGIALEWTADPTCGQRAASVEPVASVREPVDWASVDSIPERLRQILEHGGPPVPLDGVVPGEPEPAHPEPAIP